MFLRLFLLFVFVPLADLILLFAISSVTSFWFAVALIIVSALLGAYFAKRSGMTVMRQIREKLAARQMPTGSLADAAIVLFAAGLLLTPGLITDTIGMTMLIPYTRRWYKKHLSNWFKKRFKIASFSNATGFHNESEVVDSYVVDRDNNSAQSSDSATPRKVDPKKIHLEVDD